MTDIDVYTLQVSLREAWGRDTSSAPERWTEDRPSIGQCAVSSLIIQDYLGGGLRRVTVGDESHYFNGLPDGTDVDVTFDQFDDWNPSATEERDRDYVLSFPDTVRRYEILLERVQAILAP